MSIPGRAPYDTSCGICAAGISQGSTVKVAASPRNRKRVTIDVGQADAPKRTRLSTLVVGAQVSTPPQARYARPTPYTASGPRPGPQQDDSERIRLLAQLAQLHQHGHLTDTEFAAQKAKVLGD